jgi:hypothetical protein
MALYNVDRNTINTRGGSLLQQLDGTFARLQQFKAFLDTIPDATLIALYGYVQADINDLRSALTDAEQLRTIYQGTATLASAKDFRTFASRVYAFGSL